MRTSAPAARPWAQTALLLGLSLLAAPCPARAHAFLQHADPKVGSTVAASPTEVRIWFDSDLEPAFSTIAIHGPGGGAIGDQRARVDPKDPKLLEMSVPPLAPGTYEVGWSVVARDGHRTSGNYRFTVK